jgi:hypothetical protein
MSDHADIGYNIENISYKINNLRSVLSMAAEHETGESSAVLWSVYDSLEPLVGALELQVSNLFALHREELKEEVKSTKKGKSK